MHTVYGGCILPPSAVYKVVHQGRVFLYNFYLILLPYLIEFKYKLKSILGRPEKVTQIQMIQSYSDRLEDKPALRERISEDAPCYFCHRA